MRPFAFETTTKDSWNHRIALCLPEDQCAMNGRTVLTELGPDARRAAHEQTATRSCSISGSARCRSIAACASPIPTSPRSCARIAAIRCSPARRWASSSPTNPHRVFLSRLGRVEVFQPIPPPDGKSPDGPHTHVLPGLLRHRRTHAATEPIPDGLRAVRACLSAASGEGRHGAHAGRSTARATRRSRRSCAATAIRNSWR